MKQSNQVRTIIFQTVKRQKILSFGILAAVIGAIVTDLLPPMILGKIIDTITAGKAVTFAMIVLYFALLALTGFAEAAREGMLTVFGQKITHALRSSLMGKFVNLTADEISRQEPGTLVSRFVGDVDTVENLFTSGIISMFADACKIISILVVVWFQNKGLMLVLLVVLPVLFAYTRHVQKNMLTAQIENRRAVGRASGHVPETLHNICTIHCLKKEKYMEKRYDQYIGESYQAMERTNFYDAIYSDRSDPECSSCRSGDAVFCNRESKGTGIFRNVGRNGCGGHELYFPDLHSGRKPWYGDPDDSVCDCGNPQNQ